MLIISKIEKMNYLIYRYYQLAYSYHIQLDSAYNLFLLGENVCYIIDSKLNRQENMEVVLN